MRTVTKIVEKVTLYFSICRVNPRLGRERGGGVRKSSFQLWTVIRISNSGRVNPTVRTHRVNPRCDPHKAENQKKDIGV